MLIKRLSYKKIQIKHSVSIYCNGEEIGKSILTTKYKYNEDEIPLHITTHSKTTNFISRDYGIRMKKIYIRTKSIKVNFEDKDITLNRYPDFIDFIDDKWFLGYKQVKRDKILNNLLNI